MSFFTSFQLHHLNTYMKNDMNHSISKKHPSNELAMEFRATEKFIMALFLLLIISILVVSGWSAALVMLGYEEGGGPIGAVFNLLS